MAGVTNSMQFGLGRGLGAFLSGQIYTHTGLSLAQVLSLTQFFIDSKMRPSLAQLMAFWEAISLPDLDFAFCVA